MILITTQNCSLTTNQGLFLPFAVKTEIDTINFDGEVIQNALDNGWVKLAEEPKPEVKPAKVEETKPIKNATTTLA